MTTVKTTALLIINPRSRMGGEADITEGIALLEDAGFTIIQAESTSAENTGQLIDQYRAQIQLVILGGGDGTISSAAAALYRHHMTFAILPLGTANDLARSLDMSNDVSAAFQNIVENNRHRVNLGVINGHYFFNAANIGLGVQVTRELTPEVKKKWGVFSYLKAVFAAFKHHRRFRARIIVDGKPHRVSSIQLAVGNGRYYGGGNIIDEKSTIDDGLLQLYSLPPLSLWELLTLAPLLRSGKHRNAVHIFCAAGKRIEIHTTKRRSIHADGEPIGSTPAIFEVIPQALEVICPKRPDEKTEPSL